jgi:DNA-binding transcriptional MocR family regulator
MNSPVKYRSLAQQIIDRIEKKQLIVNTKLPSLRTFCHVHQISMTTALACYRYLEQRGYLCAESKKGYYVQKPSTPNSKAKFPTFQSTICSTVGKKVFSGDAIPQHSLAMAQLDANLMDYERLKRSFKSITNHCDFNLNYDENQGSSQLRNQLSQHFTKQGFACLAEDLVITNGCLDAVLIALECVSKAGDVIVVSSPCYSGLLDILTLLDRSILEIPSTAKGLDIEQLEQALKSKKISACLLTANHQNPTGHSLSNEQKQKIVELASHYEIPIIEDDVFRELSHQKTVPLPMKYFDQHGWVLWCSSVSKTLAPGIRLGWCLPGRFKDIYTNQRKIRTLGHNQPMQLALADYIGNGYYSSHLKKVNRILSIHCAEYVDYLQQQLPEQTDIFAPHGGLVLWIRIPNINSEKLTKVLFNQGVYIKQGNLFSTTVLYQDCIRINMGLIPEQKIYSQLKLISQAVQSQLQQ